MTKIAPITAVKDVKASSKWYQSVFGSRNAHGGNDFAVLESKNDNIVICLYKCGEIHPNPNSTKMESSVRDPDG